MENPYSMKPKSNTRLKDLSEQQKKIRDGLSSNTLNFLDEAEQFYGSRLRLTSGKREASQKIGSHSTTSKHNTGDAFDIGAEHDDFYYHMLNTSQGLEIMTRHGFGTIDETDPVIKAKNKATGDHFHFGMDSYYAKQAKERNTIIVGGNELPPLISYRGLQKGGVYPQLTEQKPEVGERLSTNEAEVTGIEDYVQEMVVEQQANEENTDRQVLQEVDTEVKQEKSRLASVMEMFDQISGGVDNNYTTNTDTPYIESEIPMIQSQEIQDIFIGGYNG